VEELSTVEKVFDLGTPLFSRDFIVVDLIPSIVFAGSIAGLLMAGAPGQAPNGRDLADALTHTTGTSLVVLFAVSMVLAIVTHPFRVRIRRLLTGAWTGKYTSRLAAILKRRSQDRFDEANAAIKVASSELDSPELQVKGDDYTRKFPDWPFVAPTRLGNAYEALRNLIPESEELGVLLSHAEPKRYRAAYSQARDEKDPIVVAVDDARFRIAAAERYTVMWIAAAAVYLWLLVDHGWWMLLAGVALLIARVSYLGAVDSVIEFNYLAEQLLTRAKARKRSASPSQREPGGGAEGRTP
jgi:hypothetical protein